MADEPARTGEEATVRTELQDDDQQVGDPVADIPTGDRDQTRRSHFIDVQADEDGDPSTTEADSR